MKVLTLIKAKSNVFLWYIQCCSCTRRSKIKILATRAPPSWIEFDVVTSQRQTSIVTSQRQSSLTKGQLSNWQEHWPFVEHWPFLFLSDEGPMLEWLDYTIRIGSTPTFLYFDLYLYSAYAAHFVYFILNMTCDCCFPCSCVYWSLVKARKIVWVSHVIDSSSITQSEALWVCKREILGCSSPLNATSYPGSLLGARELAGGKTLVQAGHVVT